MECFWHGYQVQNISAVKCHWEFLHYKISSLIFWRTLRVATWSRRSLWVKTLWWRPSMESLWWWATWGSLMGPWWGASVTFGWGASVALWGRSAVTHRRTLGCSHRRSLRMMSRWGLLTRVWLPNLKIFSKLHG